MKIGVGITTYNSEKVYSELYESLPREKIDVLVTVNGGKEYKDKYTDSHWIQHANNCFPSMCRNDCLRFMHERDVDYFITIEDDMVIKDKDIFERYIDAANITKLGYFCFVSTSWGSGAPGNRTPKLELQYSKDISICLYPNMCNEFTFKTKKCFNDTGLYNNKFRYLFDVDNIFKISQTNHMLGFWWFPDIKNSDSLIMNNPNSQTRLNAGGDRDKKLQAEYELFYNLHSINIPNIPNISKEEILQKIKKL